MLYWALLRSVGGFSLERETVHDITEFFLQCIEEMQLNILFDHWAFIEKFLF